MASGARRNSLCSARNVNELLQPFSTIAASVDLRQRFHLHWVTRRQMMTNITYARRVGSMRGIPQ
jgi:hypothetical protein